MDESVCQHGNERAREALIRNLCGTMTLNQYKKYMIQYATIEKYRMLSRRHTISDEIETFTMKTGTSTESLILEFCSWSC